MTPRRAWMPLAALAGVAATYAHTLHFGLWWDDYAWRSGRGRGPTWAARSSARGIPGTSGPSSHRPLSVAYYAAAFWLFGLNAWALHLLALAYFAVAACLLGWFIRRETSSTPLAALAAALYGAHPAIVYAQGPWLFLQNHALCTDVVLAALVAWQRRRCRRSAAGGHSPRSR